MYIIRLQGGDEAVRRRQDEALKQALVGHKYIRTETPEELQDLTGRLEGSACLFVIALGAGGYNEAYRKLVAVLYENKTLLALYCSRPHQKSFQERGLYTCRLRFGRKAVRPLTATA